MKTVKGDLLKLAKEGQFDVIIHGCNCFCTMGAGIAKQIKLTFPDAYSADLKTEQGNRAKLGTYSSANLVNVNYQLVIVNAYTQYHWHGKGVKADYDAIEHVFTLIKQDFSGLRIGYPLIGARLAGGDWERIAPIIDEALFEENHTLVCYQSS
ncbi:macro domain-containing protein [Shewanella surugensis]|uniref:Macro domain-containing protein n=1 Tax=Shewanella surugensis TaxID=212020 RepID=A0ABT0LE35_9GAMM|nr:macro domain-containing protein [Shewanella surugensis]MCL1125969.1 macro domain-containing protein [Shewanella surugensis]